MWITFLPLHTAKICPQLPVSSVQAVETVRHIPAVSCSRQLYTDYSVVCSIPLLSAAIPAIFCRASRLLDRVAMVFSTAACSLVLQFRNWSIAGCSDCKQGYQIDHITQYYLPCTDVPCHCRPRCTHGCPSAPCLQMLYPTLAHRLGLLDMKTHVVTQGKQKTSLIHVSTFAHYHK